jgi:hypothetical protein
LIKMELNYTTRILFLRMMLLGTCLLHGSRLFQGPPWQPYSSRLWSRPTMQKSKIL